MPLRNTKFELSPLQLPLVEHQFTKHTDQGELQATQLKLSISHWHRISSPHTVVDFSSNSLNLEMILYEEEGAAGNSIKHGPEKKSRKFVGFLRRTSCDEVELTWKDRKMMKALTSLPAQ